MYKNNQEIKVSLPELPKSNKPLKLPSNLFCVFYEVGLLKSQSKDNKSLGSLDDAENPALQVWYSLHTNYYSLLLSWFLHLAVIPWPTGMQTNLYKYIHQPSFLG